MDSFAFVVFAAILDRGLGIDLSIHGCRGAQLLCEQLPVGLNLTSMSSSSLFLGLILYITTKVRQNTVFTLYTGWLYVVRWYGWVHSLTMAWTMHLQSLLIVHISVLGRESSMYKHFPVLSSNFLTLSCIVYRSRDGQAATKGQAISHQLFRDVMCVYIRYTQVLD